MSKIYREFDRLVKDVYPTPNGGCSLTFKRKKELANFFFLGFRAALGSVIMGTDDSEEGYAARLEAMTKEIDEHFAGEAPAGSVGTTMDSEDVE